MAGSGTAHLRDQDLMLRVEHLETLLVEHDPAALLDELAAHKPRVLDKWLDRSGA